MKKKYLFSVIIIVILAFVIVVMSDFTKLAGKYTFLEQDVSSDVILDGTLIQFPAGIAFIMMDVEMDGLRLKCANFTKLSELGSLTFSVSSHSKNDLLFYWDFVIPYSGNQMSDKGYFHSTEINENGYMNVDTYNLILVP